MARMISIDLDKVIAAGRELAAQLPSLIEAGVPIPAALSQWMPMAAPVMGVLDKLAGSSEGQAWKGFPDAGQLGRGRNAYLRARKRYGDESVCAAYGKVIRTLKKTGPDLAEQIEGILNYTLDMIAPDVESHSAQQTRVALDRLLEGDGLPGDCADRLGDYIYYVLTHKEQPRPEE